MFTKLSKIKSHLKKGNIQEAEKLLQENPDLEAKLAKQNDFFRDCISNVNLSAVTFLIERGADTRVTLGKGMNALGWAIFGQDKFDDRIKIVEALFEADPTLCHACESHGHQLIEALAEKNWRMFSYFLGRVKSLDEIKNITDDKGRTLESYVNAAKHATVQSQYENKKAELSNAQSMPIVKPMKQQDEKPETPVKTGRQVIEFVEKLSGDKTLSEIYNFQSCRRITVLETTNGVDTTIENFSDIKDADVIENAAADLMAQGGHPGTIWQRKVVYRAFDKGPDTSVTP